MITVKNDSGFEAFFEEEYIVGITKIPLRLGIDKKVCELNVFYATEHGKIKIYDFACPQEKADAFILQW